MRELKDGGAWQRPNARMQKSLPSHYYTSAEIFNRERNLIFAQEWFCAGREEELSGPGNYGVLEVAGESILVVRTAKGELQAHYNVCRHRGARPCATPQDSEWNVKLAGGVTPSGSIRCSYHQWTYSLEGDLLGAPFLKDAEGFCKEDFSLYPAGVDTWGGFFFLNLNPKDAADTHRGVRSQLGPAVHRVARYPLAEIRTGHRITYDVAANWKILMENYNECYHCGGLHPELCEIVPEFKQAGGANLTWDDGIPHRDGASTRPQFRASRVPASKVPLRQGRQRRLSRCARLRSLRRRSCFCQEFETPQGSGTESRANRAINIDFLTLFCKQGRRFDASYCQGFRPTNSFPLLHLVVTPALILPIRFSTPEWAVCVSRCFLT